MCGNTIHTDPAAFYPRAEVMTRTAALCQWLDRLTRLRAVTLTGASCVHLLPAQLTFLQLNNCYESLEVRSLPAQLIFLQLNNCYESLEVRSHLPSHTLDLQCCEANEF